MQVLHKNNMTMKENYQKIISLKCKHPHTAPLSQQPPYLMRNIATAPERLLNPLHASSQVGLLCYLMVKRNQSLLSERMSSGESGCLCRRPLPPPPLNIIIFHFFLQKIDLDNGVSILAYHQSSCPLLSKTPSSPFPRFSFSRQPLAFQLKFHRLF